MDERTRGRKVRDAVSELASNTKFTISNETIFLRVPSGITDEQRAIIRENRDALFCYLTTPPVTGQCWRGHPVKWKINEWGVWLCSCYWTPPPLLEPLPVVEVSPVASHWQ